MPGRPCPPLDLARSASQTMRSSRAEISGRNGRRASVRGSAAALRSGCVPLNAPLRSPLHFPRAPTADRSRVPITNASAHNERRSITRNDVHRLNSFDGNGLDVGPAFGQRGEFARERSDPGDGQVLKSEPNFFQITAFDGNLPALE